MHADGSDQPGMGILSVRDDGRYVLRFERHIAHPPERVWRALTEPAELRRWFPADIVGERKPGAKIRFVFRDTAPRAEDMPDLLEHDPEDLDGEFTEFDPPRLLAYLWGEEDLRWELEPIAEGCRLIFTHTFTERSGIPHPGGPVKKAARTAAGWDVCLASLTALLGNSVAPPEDLWPLLYGRYARQFG
jgi:uncharacterized protein YndB with AHSA1/START domain